VLNLIECSSCSTLQTTHVEGEPSPIQLIKRRKHACRKSTDPLEGERLTSVFLGFNNVTLCSRSSLYVSITSIHSISLLSTSTASAAPLPPSLLGLWTYITIHVFSSRAVSLIAATSRIRARPRPPYFTCPLDPPGVVQVRCAYTYEVRGHKRHENVALIVCRLYKTGDLVSEDLSGDLHIIGRKDH
jgi:hypothetical protein